MFCSNPLVLTSHFLPFPITFMCSDSNFALLEFTLHAVRRESQQWAVFISHCLRLTREHREPELTDWNATLWVYRVTQNKKNGVLHLGPIALQGGEN